MKKILWSLAVFHLLGFGGIARADVFNLGTGFANLETVRVDDLLNYGEVSGEAGGSNGMGPAGMCGSVGYSYSIGKYEVTAKQYTDFLNRVAKVDAYGLYNTKMASPGRLPLYLYGCNIQRSGEGTLLNPYIYTVAEDWANRPVNYVSYWDACRFANWLHNGQPTGLQNASTTERGAYTLDGYVGNDGRAIQRCAGWKWAVTSEDEWYKAAYYKGGGINAGYWDYPMRSNTVDVFTGNDILTPDPGNNANFYQNGWSTGDPYFLTEVGEYEHSKSAYGTYDQGGDVREWNETILYQDANYTYRGLRGGAFYDSDARLRSNYRDYAIGGSAYEYYNIGFRVVHISGPAYGLSNRSAYDSIATAAAAKCSFRVWGKVAVVVYGSSFTVDDGSGAPVNVVAPGFSSVRDGDYASVTGQLSGDVSDRVLYAQASDVLKMN